MNSIFKYISNGNIDKKTNELTSVGYVCEYIYTHYTCIFTEVVNCKVLNIFKRMNAVETAAILSDVGVVDKNMMSILHRHLKYKFGSSILSKTTDLVSLTHSYSKRQLVDYDLTNSVESLLDRVVGHYLTESPAVLYQPGGMVLAFCGDASPSPRKPPLLPPDTRAVGVTYKKYGDNIM